MGGHEHENERVWLEKTQVPPFWHGLGISLEHMRADCFKSVLSVVGASLVVNIGMVGIVIEIVNGSGSSYTTEAFFCDLEIFEQYGPSNVMFL